ncbi:MAG: family 43 glycosylhydrolase, partial [Bacteroidota bacterium]
MKKIIIIALVLCSINVCLYAQDYPYGNPVITHMYTADAAPHVMPDGRVWMVTSVDHEEGGGYATMHKYHTFSSADLVNWVDHGEVLNVWEVLGSNQEPENEDWALWAPDMIYHRGKYYLYFPIRILHTDTLRPNGGRVVTSYIAVAESESPDQKFTVINPKIEGTRGIDPSVFIDDDGEKYLYFGNHWG